MTLFPLHTLIVLKILKPLWAVLRITPGSCRCQWSSLMSVCPWWINNNCAGTSGSPCEEPAVSESRSTPRSHREIWSSEPAAANTELSRGCHSTDVMGAVWCLNRAAGWPLWNDGEKAFGFCLNQKYKLFNIRICVLGNKRYKVYIYSFNFSQYNNNKIGWIFPFSFRIKTSKVFTIFIHNDMIFILSG